MINLKKISVLSLIGTMLFQNISALADGIDKSKNYLPTMEELIANDYILYLANSGTQHPTEVNAGDKMGLYQSILDQEYGEDAGTGFTWGYRNESPNAMVEARNSDSIIKSETILYQSPSIEYDSGKSGIFYGFQLPEGHYEVTIGVKNPWDSRSAAVDIEGAMIEKNISLTKGEEVIKTYGAEVSDGELNLRIYNPDRTSQYNDPLISYIIVKAEATYTKEVLKSKLEIMPVYNEEEKAQYVESTIRDYEKALNNASELVKDEANPTEIQIKEAYEALDITYNSLRKIVIYSSFNPDESWSDAPWVDNESNPIQAHGGQVQQLTVNGETKWWWYGEDKSLGYRGGVRAYSSNDLYNWNFEGVVLQTMNSKEEIDTEPYFAELYGDYTAEQKETVYQTVNKTTSVIERPKVIYNEKTNKYVMWFHADGPVTEGGSNYAVASAGVAISDSPVGPFKVIDRYRLDTSTNYTGEEKGMARDMNLFVDDDGTGYIMYASEQNATMYISRLNDEYTYLAVSPSESVEDVDFTRNFIGMSREAPAMFKYDGKYYLMTSGCTGWIPNAAKYAVADSPLGPWTDLGNPCIDDTSNTTFHTQSTCIFPVDAENGKFIYMGDRWSSPEVAGTSGDLTDSRYVWLPVEFDQNGEMILKYYEEWTLNDLNYKGKITVETSLPSFTYLGEELKLPERLTVSTKSETIDTSVVWDKTDFNEPGVITVKGTLTALADKTVTTEIIVLPRNLVYFANPSSLTEEGSTTDFEKIIESSETVLNNIADQEYIEGETSWGYTNAEGTDVRGTADMFDGLRYITKTAEERDFSYKFALRSGEYTVYVGYYDPWSQWAKERNVNTSINGVLVDENRNISGNYDTAVYKDIVISEDETMEVNFSPVNSGDSTDIQISWLMIVNNKELAGNKEELKNTLDKAKELLKQDETYTEESLNALKSAIELGEGVYADDEALKEEVDEAITKISNAIDSLKMVDKDEPVDDDRDNNKPAGDNEQSSGSKDDSIISGTGSSGIGSDGQGNGTLGNNSSNNPTNINKTNTSNTSKGNSLVNTGKENNIVILAMLLFITGAGLVIKRKNTNEAK